MGTPSFASHTLQLMPSNEHAVAVSLLSQVPDSLGSVMLFLCSLTSLSSISTLVCTLTLKLGVRHA